MKLLIFTLFGTLLFSAGVMSTDTISSLDKHLDEIKKELDVKFNFESALYYDTRSDNINMSYPGILFGYGGAGIEEAINDFGITRDTQIDFTFGARARFTLTGVATQDLMNKNLEEGKDHKIDIAREKMLKSYQEKALAKTKQEMKQKGKDFDKLPKTYQDSVIKTVNAAVEQAFDAQTKAKFNALRKEKSKLIEDRQDEMLAEQTFKEARVIGIKYVDGLKGLVFVNVGKGQLPTSAYTDDGGKTYLDLMRNSENIHGASSVANTGMIHSGYVTKVGDNTQVRIDFALYHDRMENQSEAQYIANSMGISEEQFNDYRDWWEINSFLFRILVRNPKYEIYLSASTAPNGKDRLAAGIMFKVGKKGKIMFDLYHGEGDDVLTKDAVSLFYERDLGHFMNILTLSAYVGVEYNRGALDYRIDLGLEDSYRRNYVDGIIGLKLVSAPFDFVIKGKKLVVKFSTNIEYSRRADDDEHEIANQKNAGRIAFFIEVNF